MMLNVGNKVVYPCHGPCRIGPVVTKELAGRKTSFYPLAVIDHRGVVLFVPVDKAANLGIRGLMGKSEILRLLDRMSRETNAPMASDPVTNWKRRTIDNAALLASGSATDLARVIGSLTELNETKVLSPRDRQVLDEARKNLICEISEVIGESQSGAETRLNHALQIKINKVRILQGRALRGHLSRERPA